MNELVKWFQHNYPDLVQQMHECSHHYNTESLNPYHLEGDVWTHTMMACNELKYSNNVILNVAALLHDIGKPACRTEIHEKQRVSFFSHEPLSAHMSLDITEALGLSIDERISVFKLIAMHTEPFKLDTDKLCSRFVNQKYFLDQLITLSNADKGGRFHSTEENNNTFFPVLTLKIPKRDKTVTVMVGLPCSGKTTYVRELKEVKPFSFVVSRDSIITSQFPELSYNEAWECVNQKKVGTLLQSLFKEARESGDDVIVDMTHMSRKSRRKTLAHFPRKEFNYKAVVCLTNSTDIDIRNKEREGKYIDYHVLSKMRKAFYLPMLDEFDEIEWRLT